MKKAIRPLIASLVGAVAIGGLTYAYLIMRQERDLEARAEAPVAAPSRVERDKDGTALLRLDAGSVERLGLQRAVPVTGFVARAVIGTARVLDGAALAGQLNEVRAAQTALESARLDYERKKKLFDNGQNASAAVVETAVALMKQNQVALDSAHDRLVAAWGVNIAKREDLKALARSLLSREAALVRVELLATAKLAAEPLIARLLRQNGEDLATARVLGAALNADSAVIGQAFLGLVSSNATSLVPNSLVVARLETGQRDGGVVLPRGAVVRHAGQGWVYLETASQTFARHPVSLDRPHPDGWLVPGPWTRPVVVAGAQSLLSEELKGTIQMRD